VLSVFFFFLGFFTKNAFVSPACFGGGGRQAEVKKCDSKMDYGFIFDFAEVLTP